MATVTNTINLPDGSTPTTAAVEIELVASTTSRAAGWVTATDVTLLGVKRPTVTNGAWSADLIPNANITPSGTVYKITEYADRHRYTHYISVGSGGGTVHDLLVDVPASLASAALTDHIADTAGAHAASAISVADSGALWTGSTVEAVLAEVPVDTNRKIKKNREGNALRIVTLACGSDDETVATTSCTSSVDTSNYKVGDRAWKMTMAGAVTAQLRWDPLTSDEDPLNVPPPSAVGIWIYLEDASKVDYVQVDVYGSSDLATVWTRTSTNAGVTLVNGWNLIRWAASNSTYAALVSIYRLRVVVDTNAATTATVGHVWLECAEKASIMFVEDSGYASFYSVGYPLMRARNYPVTWAVDPALFGTGSGSSARMTEAQFHAAIASGNGDSGSFHGWDGAATAAMSEAEIRTDTVKAQKWLARNGPYPGRFWRAAWTQNSATNGAAADPYLWAGASVVGASGSLTCFPLPSGFQHSLPRYLLQGRSEADLDTMFTELETTRALLNCYTHGIDDAGGIHTTTAMWSYFLDKVDAAVEEGWCEVVTMEDLFIRSGGRFTNTSGGMLVEWPDESGALQRMVIP